jgi:hypothetical protein
MEVTSIYLASYLLGTRSNLIVRNGPDSVSRYLDACPAFALLDLSVLGSFNESKPIGKCNVRVRRERRNSSVGRDWSLTRQSRLGCGTNMTKQFKSASDCGK